MQRRLGSIWKGRGLAARSRHVELVEVETDPAAEASTSGCLAMYRVPKESDANTWPQRKWQAKELFAATAALARPFFCDPRYKKEAWALTICVVFAMLVEGIGLVAFSEEQKHLMTALEKKNSDDFNSSLIKIVAMIVAVIPFVGMHSYAQGALVAEWRKAMTAKMGWMYLTGTPDNRGAFYAVQLDGAIDNPDQRILEDIHHMVSNAVSLALDVMSHSMQVIAFSVVIYTISPTACLQIIVFLTCSTLLALRVFAPLLFKYSLMLTRQEASLRYGLIRVRENAESVAFFKGGPSEWTAFLRDFLSVVATMYKKIVVEGYFNAFKMGIQLATVVFPFMMVAGPYMRGEVEFGVIAQMQFAFQMITMGLMIIMERLNSFSELAVQVSRIRELEDAMLQAGASADDGSQDRPMPTAHVMGNTESSIVGDAHRTDGEEAIPGVIALSEGSDPTGPVLALEELTLFTPARPGQTPQRLLQSLSCELRPGESLLIVGDSGVGKSSLLRGIAGLWSTGSGTVRRCNSDAIFFMPQCPYMCLGTLRSQLLYPDVGRSDVTSEELQNALEEVNLGYLLKWHTLDDVKEWATVLSMGEQQRISFARLLLQPNLRLALVDEGTSACDTANELLLYSLLSRKLCSFVSIGHRTALERFHSHVLWMRRNGELDVDEPGGSAAIAEFMSMPEFRSRVFKDSCQSSAAT